MALLSCGKDRVQPNDAVEEIKKPDAYWLTPCPERPKAESDELRDAVDKISWLILMYDDCRTRHNGLIEQN